jgi:selenocysteine-specific elongation factor
MPIERVFIQKGFGAVVTGIPVDGTVRVGDLVELAPGGQTGKVRSIQRFLREAEEGGAGQCLALNIPDFNKQPPERGQVLCLPGYLKAAPCFHVRLRAVPGLDLPIRNGEPVKLHAGTSEQLGKVHLLDQAELNGGETGPATVVVSHPVAAAAHDRFIIRRLSPAVTIGGGDIVEITCSANRPRKKDSLELITGRVRFFEDADLTSPEGEDRKITYWLRTARRSGATVRDISRGTLLQVDAVRERLARLAEAGEVLPLTEEYHIHGEGYRACLGEIEARIREASSDQKALSLTLNDLRKGLDWVPPVWNRIFEDLEGRGMISVRGDKLLLHAAADALDAADRDLMDRILTLYEDTAFQSPRPEEVSELLHAEPAAVNRLLEYLCNQGRLVRLSKTVVLSRGAFKKAQDLVVRTIEEQGKLDSADFKYTIGSTRKYALAILDHLDARHVTVRIGNDRKLSPDYQRRLLE